MSKKSFDELTDFEIDLQKSDTLIEAELREVVAGATAAQIAQIVDGPDALVEERQRPHYQQLFVERHMATVRRMRALDVDLD
jgi:hypothetical protein